MISLGSTTGTCRAVVDELRREGFKAGVLKIRFMRPFPEEEIVEITKNAKAVGVIDRIYLLDMRNGLYQCQLRSFKGRVDVKSVNFIAGLEDGIFPKKAYGRHSMI